MDKADACCSTHLIDGDGTFNVAGLESFMKEVKLAERGISYAIVSIMGPQSSGKSTLLNHLFNTNFREMDDVKGRSQTTKGIWMGRCAGIEPCTIVMDLEGTDGREREDDKAFEKQSALFALAVSDIVLINMWCHDIGRDQGASTPLLKTVFQVMLQLFSPRKTTLMFVIRDQTRTRLENLEPTLREDMQKIWDSIPKPQAHKKTPLGDFFNVEVVALASFHDKEEQFTEQVASLRKRFFHSIAPGGLAGDRRGVVPASGFSFSAQQIWKVIKENRDLDLPAHKVMVAIIRCGEIANEKHASFVADEEWNALEEAVKSHPVPDFGKRLSLMIDTCLSDYDAETTYFEDNVRSSKQKELKEKLLQLVQPAYQSMLEYIWTGTLVIFKDAFDYALKGGQGFAVAARDCTKSSMKQFDERCADVIIKQASWDTGRERDKLHHDIETYVVAVRTAKLSELPTLYERKLLEALSGPVGAVLDEASDDTWPAIRGLLQRETETAVAACSAALAGFEIDKKTKDIMLSRLKDFARGVVEAKAKEEASRVVSRMKDRFTTLFSRDSNSMPRVWTENVDIRAIAKTARSSCLKMLSVLAAIRLDYEADDIGDTLILALMDSEEDSVSVDRLASNTWEQVPASKTLITPVQCKSLWRQFLSETEYAVTQAIDVKAKADDAKAQVVAAQAQAVAAQAQADDAKAQAVAAQAQAVAAQAQAAQAQAVAAQAQAAQAIAAQEARVLGNDQLNPLENLANAAATLLTLGGFTPRAWRRQR